MPAWLTRMGLHMGMEYGYGWLRWRVCAWKWDKMVIDVEHFRFWFFGVNDNEWTKHIWATVRFRSHSHSMASRSLHFNLKRETEMKCDNKNEHRMKFWNEIGNGRATGDNLWTWTGNNGFPFFNFHYRSGDSQNEDICFYSIKLTHVWWWCNDNQVTWLCCSS